MDGKMQEKKYIFYLFLKLDRRRKKSYYHKKMHFNHAFAPRQFARSSPGEIGRGFAQGGEM
jgi:hypothetical protein